MTESDAGTVGEADYSDPFSTYHHPTMLRPPAPVQYDSDPQAEQKEWDLSVKYVSSLLEELRNYKICNLCTAPISKFE